MSIFEMPVVPQVGDNHGGYIGFRSGVENSPFVMTGYCMLLFVTGATLLTIAMASNLLHVKSKNDSDLLTRISVRNGDIMSKHKVQKIIILKKLSR
jgi:hypothetical protein